MSIPNYISFFRLALIPAFVAALLASEPVHRGLQYLAFGLFATAVTSDGVDGYIARHYKMGSKMGAALDPLADKLLMNLAFIFMAVTTPYDTYIPKWLPVLILARDATITGGIYLITQRYGRMEIKPRILGKLATVVEGLAVGAVLLTLPIAQPLLAAMVIIILLSYADYVLQGLGVVRRAKAA